MIVFFSSLLTIYSQISILILGFIILIISIYLIKINLIEGGQAIVEMRNKEK